MSSYSSTYPSIRPSFQFNADAGRLDSRISYTRSTTGTYFGTEKVLSSENLLLQSRSFDTTWVTADVTLTGSQSAPDGSSTAWTLTPGTINSPHLIQQDVTITTNQQYTAVAHIKSGAATHGFIALRAAYGVYCYAELEFSTSTLTTGGTGWTGVSGTSTALGNGWFKITLTGTSPSSFLNPNLKIGIGDGNAYNPAGHPTWTSTGTETMYAWGAQLNTTGATVYDSPTTTQIAREYQTKLQTAAINAPRFEYSASDSASMGLLVEGSSTQLLTYSSDMTNVAWTENGVTASAEAIGPDGTLSAVAVREDTGTSTHLIRQSVTLNGTAATFSVYAKILGNARRLVIREDAQTGSAAVFDLTTGTVASEVAGGTGTITPVGNGWYRCTMLCAPSSGSRLCSFWVVSNTATNYETTTGDGYSGLLLAMPQAEQQSFSSSWISSTSSTVTRAADSASTPIASTGYSGNNGTMLVEVDGGYGSYPSAVSLHDGAGYERVLVSRDSLTADDSTDFYAFVGDKSGTSSTLNLSGSGSASKVAVSFATNDFAATAGGGTVVTSTSGVSPAAYLTTLQIGNQIASNPWNGHIKRIAIYSEALSDTNLQALTS